MPVYYVYVPSSDLVLPPFGWNWKSFYVYKSVLMTSCWPNSPHYKTCKTERAIRYGLIHDRNETTIRPKHYTAAKNYTFSEFTIENLKLNNKIMKAKNDVP